LISYASTLVVVAIICGTIWVSMPDISPKTAPPWAQRSALEVAREATEEDKVKREEWENEEENQPPARRRRARSNKVIACTIVGVFALGIGLGGTTIALYPNLGKHKKKFGA
jgi:hypothetical protein